MRLWTQRVIADPRRGDGHAADGTPGDCLRACVATVTGVHYDDVPHFAQHVGWWAAMRRWARARDRDFACLLPVDGSIRHAVVAEWSGLVIASGASPRGAFSHVVVADANLRIVHDPHPSRDGLVGPVTDVLVYDVPYMPVPPQLALTA